MIKYGYIKENKNLTEVNKNIDLIDENKNKRKKGKRTKLKKNKSKSSKQITTNAPPKHNKKAKKNFQNSNIIDSKDSSSRNRIKIQNNKIFLQINNIVNENNNINNNKTIKSKGKNKKIRNNAILSKIANKRKNNRKRK